MAKYFLYARKSTDEPDRQILSIEAQITELKEFAERENLNVVENRTARNFGGLRFNKFLDDIQIFPFGKFFQLRYLGFNGKNLPVRLVR